MIKKATLRNTFSGNVLLNFKYVSHYLPIDIIQQTYIYIYTHQ